MNWYTCFKVCGSSCCVWTRTQYVKETIRLIQCQAKISGNSGHRSISYNYGISVLGIVNYLRKMLHTAVRIMLTKWSRWPTRCNSNNLLSFRLAQHVSGNSLSNSLPILRSSRLWYTACGLMSPDSCVSEARIKAARTVFGVKDAARTTSFTPNGATSFTLNTQFVPPQSGPPTDNYLGTLYHML